MENLLVDRKVHISAFFDPQQWNLTQKDEEIADRLNKQLEFYVNCGYLREEVEYNMSVELAKYEYTASPYGFLNKILDNIF